MPSRMSEHHDYYLSLREILLVMQILSAVSITSKPSCLAAVRSSPFSKRPQPHSSALETVCFSR